MSLSPVADPSSPLLCSRDGAEGIAVLTLNRPARLNALNGELLVALAGAVEEIASDEAIKCLVITGAGHAFCSGADTSELAGGPGEGPHKPGAGGAESLRQGFSYARRIILGIHRMEKPVIAAVNGPAVGAGLDLACACDIRIASPGARFAASYVRVGLFPGYGGTWFYPRLLGPGRAAEMMFTGDFIEAEEAERVGLVSRVVAEESLESETLALARRLASGPPIALRLAKMMLYRGLGMDLETAMHMAATAETITLSSQDHLEGVQAARQKRAPRYQGH